MKRLKEIKGRTLISDSELKTPVVRLAYRVLVTLLIVGTLTAVVPSRASIFAVSNPAVGGDTFCVAGACCGAGFAAGCPVARTKNPYSGARIGPVSRSTGWKEKLPEVVRTDRIVRAGPRIDDV